ncbi:MAG: ribonuclease P protein component [Prevotella sp.]|jgi:ribonuclease P protein component|nr:ribonuclease P protein component [Prevotella sp.]MBP6527236.1 ribonuclease P protein component [Prevotella sp.]MBP8687168.1 ribonuclease P protein component [Prevotella sp.]MBP8935679.1 ribonuclease P protein component [Prevotella sp.]MCI1731222.1 ribonuclease P protein component [Prevotella sp.]
MSASQAENLTKQERVCSKLLIDRLFNGGKSHSMSAYPLRVVYMYMQAEDIANDEPNTQLLVSVPKKCFKRAVKRNRVKRQVREAYRRNRSIVSEKLSDGCRLVMAFIWLDPKLYDTAVVEVKMKNLIQRISEKI